MGSKPRIPTARVLTSSRIGIVCFSRSFGGLEMTTVNLAALLAARGAHVHLVVPPGSPMQAECASRALPHEAFQPFIKYGDLFTAWRLGRTFRRHAFDVAIILRSQEMHLGAIARRLAPTTRLVFYQQMQSGIAKKDLFHDLVFSQFSAWLTLTNIMRQEVLRWTNMPADRVHVAYLGRDHGAFQPSSDRRRRARRVLSLPPKGFVAGVIGRLDRQKGQMEFLAAVPAVRQRVPGAMFIIAGDETKDDPGMRGKLLARTRELGIEDCVRILPPTEDVASFMAALDTFVMPSYSETYGLVLIEAMAMGLPVISTNSGGVPELVRDGREGIIVEPKDVGQLADALTRLGRSERMRTRYGANGRKRFLQTFREETCVDRLIGILDRDEE